MKKRKAKQTNQEKLLALGMAVTKYANNENGFRQLVKKVNRKFQHPPQKGDVFYTAKKPTKIVKPPIKDKLDTAKAFRPWG